MPAAYDPVIKTVDVPIPEPVAGKAPSFDCKVLTPGCGQRLPVSGEQCR